MDRTLGTFKGVEKSKFVFKLCGLWRCKLSRSLAILYNCYSLSIIVIFLFLYDLSLSVYIFCLEDVAVEEATNNLCMTLTLITLFGKVLNFKIFLRRIQNLLHIGDEFALKNDHEILLVDQRISFFKKLSTLLYLSANIAALSSFIGGFISEERRLPYLAWFPFDWKSNLTGYVSVYLYQAIGMVIQANLNVSMDLFSAYLMYIASIKLEILGVRLEKLGQLKEYGELNLQIDKEIEREYVVELVKYVAAYQQIFK